jgi:hypothetical protein
MLQLLAQVADDYTTYGYPTQTSDAPFPTALVAIYLALAVLLIVSMWKVFQKAGKPGWAAIVPFYNTWVLLQIVGKPTWWFFLYFVPFVNIVVTVLVYVELAKCFGKGVGFAILMIFLPFIAFPMLAFGKEQYRAPVANGTGGGSTPAAPPATPVETSSSTTPDAPVDPPKQPPVV